VKPPILILDLDDTIFPTRSIPPKVFEPLFESLNEVSHDFTEKQMDIIKDDLWKYTFHEVAEKYGFNDGMRRHYQERLKTLPLDFDIEVYEDYHDLRLMELPMYLVTSGTTSVQERKIDALEIRDDFIEVHIDDRNLYPGGKKRIFTDLINENRWSPDQLLVVGDNILSEIKAARELSIPWLQIDRSMPMDLTDNRIQSLREISGFI
jgi:putative hydrolase of the HAD superfamily